MTVYPILQSVHAFFVRRSFFFLKILRAMITGFFILLLTFFMVRASGNPAEIYLGSEATPEAIEYFNHQWGLDKPAGYQFVSYLSTILKGDLGTSLIKKKPVIDVFLTYLGPTLSLMIPAAILSIGGGILLGMVASRNHKKMLDSTILFFSTAGYSLPNFFLGVILIFFFSVVLGVLPSSGNVSWKHFIMPIFTVMTSDLAVFTRFSRSSFIDVYNQSFIMSFRALGVSEKRILLAHGLPNASISLLTISGFYIGSLISGAIITETIFSWPGLGSLLVSSLKARDFPMVQGLILVFGFSIIIMNLLTDFLYGVIDPRIRKGAAA